MEIVAVAIAKAIQRNYVCAHCYGELSMGIETGQNPVDINRGCCVWCLNCGKETGFVRREYAIAKKLESERERREVDDLLIKLGILPPRPKQSTDQILKDLGFGG